MILKSFITQPEKYRWKWLTAYHQNIFIFVFFFDHKRRFQEWTIRDNCHKQGMLTEGEGSVHLTSLLR
jgi:hypothetical protein